jgi:hypothetical protein
MSYRKGIKAFNRIGNSRTTGECRGVIYKQGELYTQQEESDYE